VTYALEILRAAQRQLGRIAPQDQSRIIAAIQDLANDPRPLGSKKLTGRPAWRIRVGPYRVIYEVNDDRSSVLVVVVGHRSDVYR